MEATEPTSDAIDPIGTQLAQVRPLAVERLRVQIQRQIHQHAQFWVFAYASLIWKPAFEPAEQRLARVWGHHRALQMHSRIDRGTAHQPGLVFALLPGGSCQGMAQRVPEQRVDAVLDTLWSREMDSGVYRPCWLNCLTTAGPVRALSFMLPRRSPSHASTLTEVQLLDILRHAHGRYGRTLDYLLLTASALQANGIRDAQVQHLVALARRHRLVEGAHPAANRTV